MKALLLSALFPLALACTGQVPWQILFRVDPEQANGYFILNRAKADAMGVVRVEVDIIGTELGTSGSLSSVILETLTIDEGFFACADFRLWEELSDPFRVHYHARGFDSGGNPVVDVQSVPQGHQPWPELCRETCESNLYAYTLVAYSDGAQAVIELHEGTVNGQATRLYVKASNWQAFQDMFDPLEHFGIGGGEWSAILMPPYFQNQTDVLLLNYPAQTPPPGARDYMGYLLGPVTQNVYAVKKGKGPWRDLYAWTNEMSVQGVCGNEPGHVRTLYNADGLVQNALTTLNLNPLSCQGMMSPGGGLSWGSGHNSWCTQYHFEEQTWGNPPNFMYDVTISVIGCAEVTFGFNPHEIWYPGMFLGSGPNGDYALADVANIIVSQWTENSRRDVLSVPVNGVRDPKLLKVRKTEAPAGLYEFMVIMNDGRILTRFIDLKQSVVLNADFAAFTNVNIYPVPVQENVFAVDLELPSPTTVALTVVNNMGTPYLTESLAFDLSGKNKHVVKMATPWPNGIYHALFQYPDGSASSSSFTVEQ